MLLHRCAIRRFDKPRSPAPLFVHGDVEGGAVWIYRWQVCLGSIQSTREKEQAGVTYLLKPTFKEDLGMQVFHKCLTRNHLA
jgi:hypothetical protein